MWQKKLARYGAYFIGRLTPPSPPHRCGDPARIWPRREQGRGEGVRGAHRKQLNQAKDGAGGTERRSLHSHLILSASCSPPTPHLRAPLSRPFWDSARTPPHTHATDPRPSRVPTSVLGVYSPPRPPLGRPAGSWIPGRSPPSPRWTAASFLVRDLGVDLKVGG